ncbi:hypothetical protein Micbo1qcDRAFT_191540 [Microdochium bolleyi]|uniref:UmuC domain-containing protein n=1 Tax=Microdochium bolleyi TaxID=196109 RepID=A0A136JID7_9PEZI|nr:hypothetical protein Micbo1qcDRAFT_191540 [Microdochium bolleyi]
MAVGVESGLRRHGVPLGPGRLLLNEAAHWALTASMAVTREAHLSPTCDAEAPFLEQHLNQFTFRDPPPGGSDNNHYDASVDTTFIIARDALVMTISVLTPDPLLRGPKAPPPSPLDDDRVIVHFDYDCFYASVFENENPALKSLPLGIKQKSILATCNYVARARGVKKLMLISDAQQICPELVLMNGEDLTRFRNVSKKLWSFLRAHSWNNRVERLGLDEVFMDVSDIVAYNQSLLNPNALHASFFQLSDKDPEKGFTFDATQYFGCVHPPAGTHGLAGVTDPLGLRFILASHLAGYLRRYIEDEFGYTSSGGIAVNKSLAKLAGTVNKPKNQTTLLPYSGEDIQRFVDAYKMRKVPGIGFRTGQLIQDHLLSLDTFKNKNSHDEATDKGLTIGDVRRHDGMSKTLLYHILERPGAEKAGADKIWNLLHGVDTSEVKEASDVPAQISIEDTYMSKPLNSMGEIMRELRSLSASLIRRLRVDLTSEDTELPESAGSARLRWIAHPRTLRLSTRCRSKPGTLTSEQSTTESFSRNTRSQPVPGIVYNLDEAEEAIAEQLVQSALLPMFRRLNTERQGWNLALINICVTNMVLTGGTNEGSASVGRDISHMFRTQKDKLREFTIYGDESVPGPEIDFYPTVAPTSQQTIKAGADLGRAGHGHAEEPTIAISDTMEQASEAASLTDQDDDAVWEEDEDEQVAQHICAICHHAVPHFALAAHERFHAMA